MLPKKGQQIAATVAASGKSRGIFVTRIDSREPIGCDCRTRTHARPAEIARNGTEQIEALVEVSQERVRWPRG
jgi:hypothetical protein